MLARIARSAIVFSGTARASSTIPVENIARVVRMHVKDEEHAMKADALFQEGLELFRKEQPQGFVSAKRTVCKAEWAFELSLCLQPVALKSIWRVIFVNRRPHPFLVRLLR